jgi:hypothetical protein
MIETKSNTQRNVFLCGNLIPAKPRLKVDWNSCAEVSGSRPSGATTCPIPTVEGGRDSREIQNFGRKMCGEGRVLLKWAFRETGRMCEKWTTARSDAVNWRPYMNMVTNFLVPQKTSNSLTCWAISHSQIRLTVEQWFLKCGPETSGVLWGLARVSLKLYLFPVLS